MNDDKNITLCINEMFRDTLNVENELVDHIPLTKRGKHRRLIQKLPVQRYYHSRG